MDEEKENEEDTNNLVIKDMELEVMVALTVVMVIGVAMANIHMVADMTTMAMVEDMHLKEEEVVVILVVVDTGHIK